MKNLIKGLLGGIQLPEWLVKDEVRLPPFARIKPDSTAVESGAVTVCIECDTDAYVQYWLELLGNPEPDQYWLEVAYQCAKLDVQSALMGTKYDTRVTKQPVEIHMTRAPQWALNRFRPGRGIKAASREYEAREHYKRIRGSLPQI